MDSVRDHFWDTQANVWFDNTGWSSWVDCFILFFLTNVERNSWVRGFTKDTEKLFWFCPRLKSCYSPILVVCPEMQEGISLTYSFEEFPGKWRWEDKTQKDLRGRWRDHEWLATQLEWLRHLTENLLALLPFLALLPPLSVSAGIFRIIFTVLLSSGTGERKNESETDGGGSTRARLSDCRETERWQDA